MGQICRLFCIWYKFRKSKISGNVILLQAAHVTEVEELSSVSFSHGSQNRLEFSRVRQIVANKTFKCGGRFIKSDFNGRLEKSEFLC